MPADVPRAHEIGVSGTVLLFTAAVAVLTALLFGIIPALRATRISTRSASAGLRATTGVRHQRVSGLLVGMEVALAVTLVIGAALLVRSFHALRAVEPGFQAARLVAARVTPPFASYRDPARVAALYSRVIERVTSLPGVQSVAAVDKLPFAQSVWGIAIRVQGQSEDGSRLLPELGHFQQVIPDYFATLGIALKRGRTFTAADRDGQPPVAIVSESVARRFWPNEDAVGRRIGYAWDSPWLTIVGVVADTKQDSLRDTLSTSMYVPWEQWTRMSASEMWVVARTARNPTDIASAVRSIVAEVDRSVPVSDVRTMQTVVGDSMQKTRVTTLLVGAFALAALLLGAVGIYGVMSYLVSQRAREMGIRMALGAKPGQVQAMIVRRGAALAAAGTAAGLIAAVFATKSLGSLLYGISVRDPITFAVVPLLFLVVAAVASYAPARRATRVDPVRALRTE
jgi:putative ABC transport system permease protein